MCKLASLIYLNIHCSFFELTLFSFGAGLWLGLVSSGKSHANSIWLSYNLDLKLTQLDAAMHALQQLCLIFAELFPPPSEYQFSSHNNRRRSTFSLSTSYNFIHHTEQTESFNLALKKREEHYPPTDPYLL